MHRDITSLYSLICLCRLKFLFVLKLQTLKISGFIELKKGGLCYEE